MTTQDKLKDIYEKLKAPFPREAYEEDKSRGFKMTSVKAQYIVERLNDVLGLGAWKLEGEFEKCNSGALFHGKLTIKIDDHLIEVENTGFSPVNTNKKNNNVGDVYKGARTDCLSKCCSWIGIANDVYKGKVNPDGSYKKAKHQEQNSYQEKKACSKPLQNKKTVNSNNNSPFSDWGEPFDAAGVPLFDQSGLSDDEKAISHDYITGELRDKMSLFTNTWRVNKKLLQYLLGIKNLNDVHNFNPSQKGAAVHFLNEKLKIKERLELEGALNQAQGQ